MKLLSSKQLWIPFLLGVLIILLAAVFVSKQLPQKESLPKVSQTSPKEVNDAYEQEVRTLYESSKVAAACGIRIETMVKGMQTLRVPKEKRTVHLTAFLALSKLPKETGDVSCDDVIRSHLTPLLSSSL